MQWKRSKHKKCFPQEHWQPTLVIHSVRASPFLFAVVLQLESTRLPIGCSTPLSSSTALSMRQYVIVMRGRFAAQESLALDLDIMVEVHVNIKKE